MEASLDDERDLPCQIMMDSQRLGTELPDAVNPSTSVLTHPIYVQDPAFYFSDGSVILLVETTLFKVHAAILGREAAAFQDLSDPSKNSGMIPIDLSGEIVFRIPNMKADHLRHFMFMFYGLPTNKGYRNLMIDTADFCPVNNPHYYWYIYVDVADVASRFMASNLEAWAHKRLRKVSSTAYEELARYSLRMEYRLRALSYAKRTHDDELLTDIRNAAQLHFAWTSQHSPLLPTLNANALDSSREKLIWLFKYPNIQQNDPSIFGFAFCSLLAHGHEVWMNAASLSRDDRVMFLFGQLHLASLPVSTLGLEWLGTLTVQNQQGKGTPIECCSECNFYIKWEAAFGGTYRQQLYAATPPLYGITHLAMLPYQRLVWFELIRDDPPTCTNSCHSKVLRFIDGCIQDTYARLATFCRDVE